MSSVLLPWISNFIRTEIRGNYVFIFRRRGHENATHSRCCFRNRLVRFTRTKNMCTNSAHQFLLVCVYVHTARRTSVLQRCAAHHERLMHFRGEAHVSVLTCYRGPSPPSLNAFPLHTYRYTYVTPFFCLHQSVFIVAYVLHRRLFPQ